MRFILIALALAAAPLAAQQVQPLVQAELPGLLQTYQSLHEAPELSHFEAKTSSFIAGQLRALGYEVADNIGVYAGHPEWHGYGVVGILRNGPGPVVLVRTELDALPVTEQTGRAYASRVPGVMHACGHDIHMAAFLGTAAALARLKSQWHGTLEMVAQPAEETINGAAAMLADGMYTRFPRPDLLLAEHDDPSLAAGTVGFVSGYSMASATSVKIVLHGISAHGSRPEAGKDPVVAAAELVTALQGIVSRETSPFDQAVVTVGSLQAGTKNNIIPDSATLLLSVRTYKDEVRQRILASIKRMANGIAIADALPANQPPEVSVYEYTPALYNDPALSVRMEAALKHALGANNVLHQQPVMASEDFGAFGLEHRIPLFDYNLGAVSAEALAQSQRTGVPLPSLHSSKFAPLPEPTLRTGITALTSVALAALQAAGGTAAR
ncbi:MAG TPA: amidohydrolase [Terriglobales bacterium]|nr:amidohydrolase [Terriglobales bacterium]